jgi:hypothetical protein
VLPNLIVIGAGKCGTTSLHRYLDAHPEIEMSRMKEPSFFVAERNWGRGRSWYEAQWRDARAAVHGEASPQYTKHPVHEGVPERMHALVPDAKLIYLVRDPVERIVSYYVDRRARGREDRSLAEALERSPDDGYVAASRYAMQLERYLRLFPQERVLVLELSRARLGEVFRFLGVDESFETSLFDRVHNASAAKRRVVRGPRWVPRDPLPAPEGRLPWALRERVRRLALRPFTAAVERPAIDDALRARLEDVLAPDARRLRELTGQAFPGWSV